jgi:nitrate/nitrite transport system substrate-binding protein
LRRRPTPRDPANRPEIAAAISERAFLNQPTEVVEAVLTGTLKTARATPSSVPDRIDFDPYPWQSFANWISSQLVRWDLQGDGMAAKITEEGYAPWGKTSF